MSPEFYRDENEIFEIEPKDHFLEMLDAFCMEIRGTKKAPFDFEQELLNQARAMFAASSSANGTKGVFWFEDYQNTNV